MPTLSFRQAAFGGWLLPLLAMAWALYLQHGMQLEPCPLCVFQRIAMIGLGLVWLLAWIHSPRTTLGRGFYGGAGVLAAALGSAIAGRHVWLQSLPEDQVPACGPSLDYLLDIAPMQEVVATVLRGDGNCAIIDAAFLGMSIPAWTLVAFLGLAVVSLTIPLVATSEHT